MFDDEYAMVGCLNGGIGNDYLSGVGDTELGIGVFQPYFNTETKLVFDTDSDWKTIGEMLKTPQVVCIAPGALLMEVLSILVPCSISHILTGRFVTF